MITITITQLVAILGIPSIISGIFMLQIQMAANRREKKRDVQESARCEHESLSQKSTSASLTLGIVIAEAVQRIPDAHCNGEMHKALEEAKDVRTENMEFMTKQGLAYMHQYKS